MEHTWYVTTGKIPQLSQLELERQLPWRGDLKSISSVSQDLLKIKSDFYPSDIILDRFGGIKKVMLWRTDIINARLFDSLIKLIMDDSNLGRDIGISCIGGMNSREVQRFAIRLKKQLVHLKRPTRVVFDQLGTEISAVVVRKQLMHKNGGEFVCVWEDDHWAVTQTVWVHQFEEWGEREFGKPDVDRRRGLLPQKLARIMVNLTGLRLGPETTIVDPFCGSGVILMEARELGCQFVASDIDERAVVASKRNLGLELDDGRVFQADARTVAIPPLDANHLAIVTEPLLGPLWSAQADRGDINKAVTDLSELYVTCLSDWKPQLQAGTPVVMVFPVIYGQSTWAKSVDRILDLRYNLFSKPIHYERSDQRVTRDVVCLRVN